MEEARLFYRSAGSAPADGIGRLVLQGCNMEGIGNDS